MTIAAVSLFAGIGGFDLALQRAGIRTVAAVEIDPAARGVLADHFPHTALFHDVTEVTGDQLRTAGFVPEHGILTGGFPCQDLSVAGRRAGLAGARSGLFWDIDRLLAELTPAWVLLENVSGLLSSNSGRDMGAVLGALAERGYGFAYRVLDAQHFGVPQRRRRVFIVGHFGDPAGPAEILLEPESVRRNPAPRREAGQVVAALTANGAGAGGGVDDNTAQAGHLIAHTLTAEGHDASEDGTGRGTPLVAASMTGIGWWNQDTTTTSALAARESKDTYRLVVPPERGTPQVPVAVGVRRFVPVECERLQGFPDGWTATSHGRPQADSARYRQLGNAVAVPVVEWLARRITARFSSTSEGPVAA